MKRILFFISLISAMSFVQAAQQLSCWQKCCPRIVNLGQVIKNASCWNRCRRSQNAVQPLAAGAAGAVVVQPLAAAVVVVQPQVVGPLRVQNNVEDQREDSESSVFEAGISLNDYKPELMSIDQARAKARQLGIESSGIYIGENDVVNVAIYNYPASTALTILQEEPHPLPLLKSVKNRESNSVDEEEYRETVARLKHEAMLMRDREKELVSELSTILKTIKSFPRGGVMHQVLSNNIAELGVQIQALRSGQSAGPGNMPGHIEGTETPRENHLDAIPEEVSIVIPEPESHAAAGAGAQ